MELQKQTQSNDAVETGSLKLQVIAVISATLAYLTTGTFLGWPSPTCPILMKNDSHLPISFAECAWIATFPSLGTIFTPLPTGYFADLLGRKGVLASSSVLFVVSWLIITVARSANELYAARFLAGLAQGIAFTVGPMYIAEISEDRIRGAMGTIFQVMLNVGTLYEFSVGPYVSYNSLAISSGIFPILFLVTFVWMPESPYYYISKDNKCDAQNSLMKLRGKKKPESVKEELDKIMMTIDVQKKDKASFKDLFRIRGNRKAFFLVTGLLTAQALSGIIAVLSYTESIFKSSGSGIDASLSAIIVGIVTLVSSTVSSLLVDRTGRRPLLLISCIGCSVCMFGLGAYYYYAPIIQSSMNIDWIPLFLLILYIIVYMVGLGPLPWAIAGEVFPNNVKAYAISIVSMNVSILNVIVVKLYQIIVDASGQYTVFFIFGACCALGIIVIFYLPETKGKSFLEIYNEMNKHAGDNQVDSSMSTIATICQ